MKLLGRTLAILFVALLVSGAVYALGSAGMVGGAATAPPGAATARDGGPSVGRFHGGEGHRLGGERDGGGGIFGALEIGKNLAVIAIIVALVAGSIALGRRIWPRAHDQALPPTSRQ
ncbi:MAG: hypothetical protein WCJ55_15700 [Chloroflexales bacterium]